jgi:hypothetical protein
VDCYWTGPERASKDRKNHQYDDDIAKIMFNLNLGLTVDQRPWSMDDNPLDLARSFILELLEMIKEERLWQDITLKREVSGSQSLI